ncbi:MAG TPA: translation elongation factor Ts, partial [Chitinophagales bacterium]|nr:translation elongation factor Ts [Chitinophagales bacterium]
KNEEFIALANEIAQLALDTKVDSIEALNATEFKGSTVANIILDNVAKIGEKIEVKKFETIEGKGLVPYIHMGYRMGVIVELNQEVNEENGVIGKDVAMQIAAMNPVALDASGVSEELIERERAIAREKAIEGGKPENIIERIVEGSVKAMLKESTLLSQPFVKDTKLSVEQYVKSKDKDLSVVSYKRMSLA